jgi:hypothetical protein
MSQICDKFLDSSITIYIACYYISKLSEKRLDARGAADYPKKEHWGSTDKKLVDYYKNRSPFYATGNRVGYSAHIDAEISKCLFQDMMKEANVKNYLHSWGTEPIMEGNKAKGVIFESKSGRQAVLAKVVIDSTATGICYPMRGQLLRPISNQP